LLEVRATLSLFLRVRRKGDAVSANINCGNEQDRHMAFNQLRINVLHQHSL
jgi:hypothetical protein